MNKLNVILCVIHKPPNVALLKDVSEILTIEEEE